MMTEIGLNWTKISANDCWFERVRTGAMAEFFQTLGMRKVILDKHSRSSPPATHNRNNQ
jgi:hypothetical protein